MIENNSMRRYNQAVAKELATRLCMLLPFVVFVGAMLTHQSLATVVIMFCIYALTFRALWFPAIKRRAKCEYERRIGGVAMMPPPPSPHFQAFPDSAEHPVSSPPPRITPEN